jgi:EmrB/QacA subfamily drug resistance transporter
MTDRAAGSKIVLITLAAAQFLMTLDTSVMNVSIATVAKDLGTTITGIQGAITAYTLVMASLMITGGKIGAMIGRRRAFAIGCVIYGCGSFVTAISPNLTVLLIGWSGLEGIGAALIMPAIVALVAGNFVQKERPAAYGLIAAAAAIAVAVGPLIGGLATTFFSWRWVFAGEVVVAAGILISSRRIADAPPEQRPKLDVVGALLSIVGLASLVFGILKSSTWGVVQPKGDAPTWLNMSPVIWLLIGSVLILWLFFLRQSKLEHEGGEPLVRVSMLRIRQLDGGLLLFFAQYFVQASLFFIVPLFLSVVLGLSAIKTGARLLPLSFALLVAAVGIPRLWPDASPRRVARGGLLLLALGTMVLAAAMDADASAEIVTVPMLLMGLGAGALASQLGSVTVSSVPESETAEVGGVQNTMTNLGASIGTALSGAVLISALTGSFFANIAANPKIPARVSEEATVKLSSGVPFVSDADLEQALKAEHVPPRATQDIVDANADARLDGLRAALGLIALVALIALFFTRLIPTVQPRGPPVAAEG